MFRVGLGVSSCCRSVCQEFIVDGVVVIVCRVGTRSERGASARHCRDEMIDMKVMSTSLFAQIPLSDYDVNTYFCFP